MSVASLTRKLNEYQNYKTEVEGLITNLTKVISPLKLAKDKLETIYTYDDYVADGQKLSKLYSKLKDELANLENNILPSIKSKIKNIVSEIEMEQAREMMENTL